MATREKSARNGAAARYLRTLKANRDEKITNEELARRSGVAYETVVRLLRNRAEFTIDQFLSLAAALGVSDVEATAALAQILSE